LANQKILLTGLTSFSGCHIAKELLNNGYSVFAPLLKKANEYSGLKEERLKLSLGAQTIAPCDIQSLDFINILSDIKPQIFINHGGFIENYRSIDFDYLKHLETNLKHIKILVQTLKENGCKVFIHSGSAFEPGEEYSQFGISPYGVAKKMVWDMTVFWCVHFQLPIVKVVIPNPYGFLENDDRLLPIFAKKIKAGESVQLSGAEQIRNNIRAEHLAKYYLQASQLADKELSTNFVEIIKPIGHIETQKDFVLRALQEEPYKLNLQTIQNSLQIV
jgi:nucleoside-diphosphate-sugar epimerase